MNQHNPARLADPMVRPGVMGPHSAGSVTCTARAKATGERCQRAPIRGGTVCYVHGGASPAVKAAAARRLAVFEAEAEAENFIAFESYGGVTDPLQMMAELAERALATERALAARVNFLAQDDRLRYKAHGAGTEQIRAEVALWERWAKQAAHLADRLAAHNWEAKRVVMAEKQGAAVYAFVTDVMNEMLSYVLEALADAQVPGHVGVTLSSEWRTRYEESAREKLRALSGGGDQ